MLHVRDALMRPIFLNRWKPIQCEVYIENPKRSIPAMQHFFGLQAVGR
jgi:hypothetical protein